MKLKYPKTVKVGSTIYKIKWDKKSNGASLDWLKQEMIIGIKPKITLYILENIIHELKEAIHLDQFTRYAGGSAPNADFKFVYGHDHHTDMCSRLAGLLDEFIV